MAKRASTRLHPAAKPQNVPSTMLIHRLGVVDCPKVWPPLRRTPQHYQDSYLRSAQPLSCSLVAHASRDLLLAAQGLDVAGVVASIRRLLQDPAKGHSVHPFIRST